MIGRPLEFNLRLYPMSRRYVASEVIRVAAGPVFLRLRMANVVPCLDPAVGSQLNQARYSDVHALAVVLTHLRGFLTSPSTRFRCRL